MWPNYVETFNRPFIGSLGMKLFEKNRLKKIKLLFMGYTVSLISH